MNVILVDKDEVIAHNLEFTKLTRQVLKERGCEEIAKTLDAARQTMATLA